MKWLKNNGWRIFIYRMFKEEGLKWLKPRDLLLYFQRPMQLSTILETGMKGPMEELSPWELWARGIMGFPKGYGLPYPWPAQISNTQ